MKTIMIQLKLLFSFFPESFKEITKAMPNAPLWVRITIWLMSLGFTGSLFAGIIYILIKFPVVLERLVGGVAG